MNKTQLFKGVGKSLRITLPFYYTMPMKSTLYFFHKMKFNRPEGACDQTFSTDL